MPANPNTASPAAPIAASFANNSASSPGVLSCRPATYSVASSADLPIAAPAPVPADITPNCFKLICLSPGYWGFNLPLVNIDPPMDPIIGPTMPEKSAKSPKERPLSSIITFLFDVGSIPNFSNPFGVKAKSPLLFLVKPSPPTASSNILSFPPRVSIAPSFVLSQGAATPVS